MRVNGITASRKALAEIITQLVDITKGLLLLGYQMVMGDLLTLMATIIKDK